MAHRTTPPGGSAWMVRVAGATGLAGGAAWVVKGVAILVTARQPPLLFELALPLLALCLAGVALLAPHGRRRTTSLGLAWLAVAAGGAALWGGLLGAGVDPFITACALALLAGQLTLPRSSGTPAAVTFWLGVGTLPALAVGGALAEADERLLEIPLVCIGLGWMLVGWLTSRSRVPSPVSTR